jgi:hypothetical protein
MIVTAWKRLATALALAAVSVALVFARTPSQLCGVRRRRHESGGAADNVLLIGT